MFCVTRPVRAKRIPIAALATLFTLTCQVTAQTEKDLHRPACTDMHCKKIRSFVKSHYCGESPYGNGPDNGCLIKLPKKPRAGIEVLADFHCEWNETKQAPQCEQQGQPSSTTRDVLTQELRQAGLPTKASGKTYFKVWKSTLSGWSIAEASYSRTVGSDMTLCDVIVIIDQDTHVIVVRKVPSQKTDVDVPNVTEWSVIDLVDADDDGQVDVILEGDAYEDHWLEVVSVHAGSTQTVFSGLGYYL